MGLVLLLGLGAARQRERRWRAGAADRQLAEARALLVAHHADGPALDESAMAHGAARGMVRECDDPFAVYFRPAAFARYKQGLAARFAGVGIKTRSQRRHLDVHLVYAGGAAAERGLRAGDRITAIAGRAISDLSREQRRRLLRGTPEQPLRLALYRPDSGRAWEVSIPRRQLELPTVMHADRLPDGLAYLRIDRFGERTRGELVEALRRLTTEPLRGLVLDLRGNPGGQIGAARWLGARLLGPGLLFSIRSAGGVVEVSAEPEAAAQPLATPLVVLVDRDTASASELLAGALRERRRALLIGERTRGKGSLQRVVALDAGGGFKLATAYYQTPSGWVLHRRRAHRGGLQPDRPLVQTDAQRDATELARRIRLAAAHGPVPRSWLGKPARDRPLEIALALLRGQRPQPEPILGAGDPR